MRKNLRKIPEHIINKITDVNTTNYVDVAFVIKVKESEFYKYPALQFCLVDNTLTFNNEFIPAIRNGRYCKRNINGYTGHPLRDEPKVSKTIYMGERHAYGDLDRPTFSLYRTMQVWQREIYEPKEWSITTKLLNTNTENEQTTYTLKVSIDQLLDKTEVDFKEKLFFALNMLCENFSYFDVFSSDATLDDYLRTIKVNWKIFPNGDGSNFTSKIFGRYRNITPEIERNIKLRAEFLAQMNPIEYIFGTCHNRQYFGAKFSDELVVFENTRYGNAIYLLFADWEDISKMSRSEILKLPSDRFIRIPHKAGWESALKTLVKEKLA